VKTLEDKSEATRQGAAYALGQIGVGARVAVPALINDVNGGVRARAARALGAMAPEATAAVPALVNAMRYGDGGYSVASGAQIGLSQIGFPAVPALIAALRCKSLGPGTPMSNTGYRGPVYPELENVRLYAAQALLSIGPPARAAIPALTEALRDEHP
jgi:HEAT repeat protein